MRAVRSAPAAHPLKSLPPIDPVSGELNAIIDTPRGSRNKYEFDPKRGVFVLGGLLPAGATFPYDFGFVPGTLGGDGDPLDVLILMDEPGFVGLVVPSRLVGVLEAEQTERDGETTRNDRLIAVASASRTYAAVRSINDLPEGLVDEIEHFFVSYNEAKGKVFRVVRRGGSRLANELLAGD